MRKFVGYVNGKTFNDEESFNIAADEAIKSNDGNLAISSYYTYSDDNTEREKKALSDWNDINFVSVSDYFLGDRKPDVVNKDSVEFNLSDELKTRILNASNKQNIKKQLDYYISNLNQHIADMNSGIEDRQKQIERLQDKLFEDIEALKDFKGRKKYYEGVLDLVKEEKKEEVKEDVKEEPLTKEKIKSILGTSTFVDIINKLGLLK